MCNSANTPITIDKAGNGLMGSIVVSRELPLHPVIMKVIEMTCSMEVKDSLCCPVVIGF
jgi:hypothetical protein